MSNSGTPPTGQPGPALNPPADPEDRRKHLEFIQAVIARLSNSSSTAKGWSLTLAGAAFGFSAVNDKWYLALLGCVILLAFSVMDAYYLHAERLFRHLYEDARTGLAQVYDMNPHTYDQHHRRIDTYRTWSVLGFYGPLLLAGIVVTLVLLGGNGGDTADQHNPQETGHQRHNGETSHVDRDRSTQEGSRREQ